MIYSATPVPDLNVRNQRFLINLEIYDFKVIKVSDPFIFWSKALKLTSSTAKVSNLIYLVPFLSLILIYFVVGEKILLSTIIGLIFIIAGIIIQYRIRTVAAKPPANI